MSGARNLHNLAEQQYRGYPAPPHTSYQPVMQSASAQYYPGPIGTAQQPQASQCWDLCSKQPTDQGSMVFVGNGVGSYVTELNYSYVGRGAGDYELAPPKQTYWKYIALAVLASLLVGVGLVIFVSRSTSTTTPLLQASGAGAVGTCLLWGDPHLMTFDKTYLNWYSEGEFWIVKSDTVKIQGRYLSTPFTRGLSAMHQLAVGGPFMQGHKLTVGPMDGGQIMCDGLPICGGFPSQASCGGVALIKYDGEGGPSDDVDSNEIEKHIVHLELPGGVRIEILRWANHINGKILMRHPVAGQDGGCGNFNNDPDDDSEKQIKARIGKRVDASQLLFDHQAEANTRTPDRTISDCPKDKYTHAMTMCTAAQSHVDTVVLDTCIFDVCFGGDQYASEDSMSESQTTEHLS